MFEALFTRPDALARQRMSPYAESRARFLVYCSKLGYPLATLKKMGRRGNLWVVLHRKASAWQIAIVFMAGSGKAPHPAIQQS